MTMPDNRASSEEDRLASRLERIDQQIAGESGQPAEDHTDSLAGDADLDGAKRVLGLIHRIRARQASNEGEGGEPIASGEAETIAGEPSQAGTEDVSVPDGQVIGGYQILDQIARGGMGVVFRARDPSLNRIVALKMMIAGPFARQQERSRFRIEAEAAAALDHPGIVPVYEVGEHHGQPYFTMGLVEGETLSQRIANEPLPPQTAAEIARQIASAVAYAHERGVIHRDIKPANVLVDREGRPRITDFGLARRTDSVSDLTGTEQVLGTPSYMAPEQAAGGASSAGEVADVYAIGATLYCMLTGRPPFQAATAPETLRLVLDSEPVAPQQLNPAIANDLNTICLKCLHKEPHRRYPNAAELEADLGRFIRHEPILARPVGAFERSWKWSRRHPLVAGLSTAVLLATIALIAGGIWYQSRLSRTLDEVRRSRSTAVNSLYQSLTGEAEFLGQMRPLGYGPRVESLIAEARTLDTAAKDEQRLRQLLVSSLGFVGAREPVELEVVDAEITAAEVLPDRTGVIAGLRNGKLVLFDLATGRKAAEHGCLSIPVTRIGINAADHGKTIQVRLVGQGGREISVWTMDNSKRLTHVQTTHPKLHESFYAIQVTPNGQRVLGVQPASPDVSRPEAWVTPVTRLLGAEVAQRRRRENSGLTFALKSLDQPDRPPSSIPVPATPRFDFTEELLVVGHSWLDNTEIEGDDLRVYDLETGKPVKQWNASVGALHNVVIHPDGRHVACAGDFGVEVFHLSADRRIGKYDGLGSCSIESLIGDEGDVMVRTEKETLWLSNRQNQPIARFANREDGSYVQLSSDEKFAIWLGTTRTRVIDLRGQERQRLTAHNRIAKTVSLSPDSRLLLSTGEFYGGNLTRVWNTLTGEMEFEFVGSASTFSPDGRWIASWSGELKLWDVASGKLVTRGECLNTPSRIVFSDDGNALAACGQFPGQSRLWRIEESKSVTRGDREVALKRLDLDPQAQMPLALSPSGQRVAFRRGDSVCVLELNDERVFRTTTFPSVPRKGSVAFVDEDRLMVVAERLHVWDLAKDRLRVSQARCDAPLVLSHDRNLVLCRRQVLAADDLRPVIQFPGWVNSVAAVDWSRDGRRIALGLEGGDVTIWDLRSVVAKLEDHDLPREEFVFPSSAPVSAIGQMIQVGRRRADAVHPEQWLYRCEQLTGWVGDGVIERDQLLRRVRALSEELRRIGDRPFFTVVDSELRWPEIARAGQELAGLLQGDEQYEAQLLLLQAMVSVVERVQPETVAGLRQASMIQHSLGDVLNFFRRDNSLCLQAYQQEQVLLERLMQHPNQPQPRELLASNLFWLDRNRAMAYGRVGDIERAVESMDRAVSTFEEFPGDYVDVSTVSRAYDMLVEWLIESGRNPAADAIRRRQEAALR